MKYFYLLLLLAHVPIVFLFVVRIVQKKFVSDSVVMHLSFTCFWILNAFRIAFLAFDMVGPVPPFAEVLVIAQSMVSIPLLAYVLPMFRISLGMSCTGDICDVVMAQEAMRLQKEKELDKVKSQYKIKLDSMLRLVKQATRETKAQREFLRGRAGLETVSQWAEQQLTLLEDVNQKIIGELSDAQPVP